MTLVIIFISGIIILFLGYKFYGSFLCKEFEVDKITILPSKAKEDGVDFIPTKLWVLFGHHFLTFIIKYGIMKDVWCIILVKQDIGRWG